MARPPNITPRIPARALLMTLADAAAGARGQTALARRLAVLRRDLQVAYAAWWIALNEARPAPLGAWMAMGLGEEAIQVDAPSAWRADPGFRLRFDDEHLPPLHPEEMARWMIERIVLSRLESARIHEEVQQLSRSRRRRERARLLLVRSMEAEPERAGVIRALWASRSDEPSFHDLPEETRQLGWRCEQIARGAWALLCAHYEVHYGDPGAAASPLHMRFVPLEHLSVDPRTERVRPAPRQEPFDPEWLCVDPEAFTTLEHRLNR
ncbi:MAG: hypothetical protein AAGI01_17265, partial [Myxococcota bacterium]